MIHKKQLKSVARNSSTLKGKSDKLCPASNDNIDSDYYGVYEHCAEISYSDSPLYGLKYANKARERLASVPFEIAWSLQDVLYLPFKPYGKSLNFPVL